jgi:hypothetical protein
VNSGHQEKRSQKGSLKIVRLSILPAGNTSSRESSPSSKTEYVILYVCRLYFAKAHADTISRVRNVRKQLTTFD